MIKKIIKSFFNFFGYSIKLKNPRFEYPQKFFPIEVNEFQREIIKSCEQYSITGRIRMSNLLQLIYFVIKNEIDGDIVECGVWKGGNLILAQKCLDILKAEKKIYGFDTFEGMNKPLDIDVQIVQLKSKNAMKSQFEYRRASVWMENVTKTKNDGRNIWAYCDLDTVKKNISSKVPNNNIKLIKGKVEETLLVNQNLPQKISILRLDTDFYESTKIELEILYPRLVNEGFLIIDDYGHWQGAKKAVDEYFKDNPPFLHVVDETCRLIVKKN